MKLSTDNIKEQVAERIVKSESIFQGLGCFFGVITALCAVAWFAGFDIEPVAFGMSLVMSFFFAAPVLAKKITEVRPIERMTFEEIIDLVETSKREEWKGIDEQDCEELFYLRDPRLRIKHHSGSRGLQNDDFREKWANEFPDPKAVGFWFDLYYDQGILKRILLVAVDGFRAYVPCPNPGTSQVENFDHRIAEIAAYNLERYHTYLRQVGFEIIATSRTELRR